MNNIQTNHWPIAYEFFLLMLLVLLYCCYYCCYYCRLLLLLLATAVTTVFPCRCYCSLHCCYLLQFWFAWRWRELTISVDGQLGAIDTIVRNSLPSTDRFWHRCYHTTLVLTLCLQILIFQVWMNLINSAANTREYPLTSCWRINKFGSNTLPWKTVAIPRVGGPLTTFF